MSAPLCQLCGKSPAKYVCQKCGRLVCEFDLDPSIGNCKECIEEESLPIRPIAPKGKLDLGLLLLVVAFFMIFVGIMLIMLASLTGEGSAEVGGVVFIGPFPFVFGSGPHSGLLMLIGILIAIAMLFYFLISLRRIR